MGGYREQIDERGGERQERGVSARITLRQEKNGRKRVRGTERRQEAERGAIRAIMATTRKGKMRTS